MTCRILVVEDSATQAEALFGLLEEHAYEPVIARSAEAALEQIANNKFDVILSDVVMPGISGYELCRRVKENPISRDVPLILLTSLGDPMDIIQGLESGADNYITKPYDAEHLLARLRNVLDNRRLRRNSKTTVGVTVRFLGRDLAINSEKEQILDLFISSVEDVVRANDALQQSQRALADAHAQLERYAREKAREARVSTERYRALLQNARDAVLVLDLQGRILEANRTASHLFDVATEELLNQTLVDLAAEDGRAELQGRLAALSTEQHVEFGERRFLKAGAEEVWCDMAASVTAVDGEDLVLLILRDVTDRKASERHLFATNQRLESLIKASPVGILVNDRSGKVELWNPAAERLFGWSESEVIGKYPPFIPPDRMGEYLRYFERVLKGDSLTGVEVSRLKRDGQPVDLAIYASPLRIADGEIEGGLVLILDITERKRSEAAMREREEAERANRAKSEFLSRMSHELRTPLNAILGFGQLMEMDDLNPDHTESVEQILRAGRHLLALIDEVLDVSRIEAGNLPLSLEPVSIQSALQEVVSLMRPVAAQSGITLEDASGVTSGMCVEADMQRLKQVLLNLISNGIKYNRAGGSVRVSVSPADEGCWRISVTDSGNGIAPDHLARLFVPFERLEAAESAVQGTGLGLFLTKGLVEAMKGHIGVESTVGVGTTFWFDLRRTAGVARAEAVSNDRGAKGPEAGTKQRTVLYIEDNASNLRLVQRVLATLPNLRLLTAVDGRMGLELAREHSPDLILLDLNLPDLTADEILRRLHDDADLRNAPVVVVSADAMQRQVDRFLKMGVAEYLTKPIDVTRLLNVVGGILDGV